MLKHQCGSVSRNNNNPIMFLSYTPALCIKWHVDCTCGAACLGLSVLINFSSDWFLYLNSCNFICSEIQFCSNYRPTRYWTVLSVSARQVFLWSDREGMSPYQFYGHEYGTGDKRRHSLNQLKLMTCNIDANVRSLKFYGIDGFASIKRFRLQVISVDSSITSKDSLKVLER